MTKQIWKGGNLLNPLPAVLVGSGNEAGVRNVFTAAWAGTVCTNPPMLSVSIRPSRYSYELISETREMTVNLTTEEMAFAVDYCGVKSGRDTDKWKEMKLTPKPSSTLQYAPIVEECPVSLECKVKEIIKLGSHDMFLAEVTGVQVDERYLDEKGKLHLNEAGLLVYSHGEYRGLKKAIGTFGYSVSKKKPSVGKKAGKPYKGSHKK